MYDNISKKAKCIYTSKHTEYHLAFLDIVHQSADYIVFDSVKPYPEWNTFKYVACPKSVFLPKRGTYTDFIINLLTLPNIGEFKCFFLELNGGYNRRVYFFKESKEQVLVKIDKEDIFTKISLLNL